MKHRLTTILLTAVSVILFAGCSSLFDHSYSSSYEFKGNQELELDASTEVVKSYSALRRHIFTMVNKREEDAHLLISGYSGDVASDISSICGSVNIDSAYGAYCVEYVSYDLTQIVSYYEADIHISYKYTAEELSEIITVANNSTFADSIAEQIAVGKERIVFKVNNGIVNDEAIKALVEQSCRNHPNILSLHPVKHGW